jgi:Raf kinase inhibitor-like YbhB/YbcL family protein
MKLWSNSFRDGGYLPGEFALGTVDPVTHVTLSANPDVPSRADDVNQEGRMIPPDLPRIDFFHWVMVDIAPTIHSITAGVFSDGVTSRGKLGPQIMQPDFTSARQGLNDYTSWFADDPAMAGDYFGYDGPCPPWNDSEIHRYIFTLYALDVAQLPLREAFTGAEVRTAMAPHILAQASVVGIYTLNPTLQE